MSVLLCQRWAAPALVVLAAACGTDPVSPSVESSFVLTPGAGDGQIGRADRPLASPLEVTVTRDGRPAAGVSVIWHTVDGILEPGGSTDDRGVATAVWTLPRRPGNMRATARIDQSSTSPAVFRSEARLPALQKVAGDRQVGTVAEDLPEQLAVQVTWEGQPLAGESVTFSFLPLPVTTGPDGIAEATWKAGIVAGQSEATARISGLQSPSVRFSATLIPGPLATLELRAAVPGDALYWAHGSPLRFFVSAMDAYRNLIADVPHTWSLVAGTGTIVGTSATELGYGYVEVTPAADYAGDIRVRAASNGVEVTSNPSRFAHFLFADPAGWGDVVGPPGVAVPVGTTVRWAHLGYEEHRLAPKGGFVSGILTAHGSVFEQSFTTAGVHHWICVVHDWETFTIEVTP